MTLTADTAVLRVYDRDGTTLRGEVAATGVSWVDELGDEGSATYTAPSLQAILEATPGLLDDAIVKVAVPLAPAAAPTEVFAWLSEPGRGTLVGPQEDAGRQVSQSCRGLLALLDDAVILHDGGFRTYGLAERFVGFMSRGFTPVGWTVPQGVRYDSVVQRNPSGLPEIFDEVDPAAQWIAQGNPETTGVPVGTETLFRATVTVATAGQHRIYAAADDSLKVYVDGELLIEGSDWKIAKKADLYLTAGTHVVAVRIVNGEWPAAANITGLLLSMFALDPSGLIVQPPVLRSQPSGWLCDINDPRIGEPAPLVLLRLLDEAAARGIPSAGRWSPSFTGTTDSDGQPWDPDRVLDRAFAIGGKLGGHFLGEVGRTLFDIDARPDGTLACYNDQGSDLSASVALEQGVNIVSLTYDGVPVVATRLLVRTADGYRIVTNAAAETAGVEARESTVQLGYNESTGQAQTVAELVLRDFARVRHSYTAVIAALVGCVPYVDFGKGDLITCPDYRGTPTPMQVVSIGGQMNADGLVLWTVELEEI